MEIENLATPTAWAVLLFLYLLAASVVLQLNIPSSSAWTLLQPFTLVVVLSAIVHLPKQGRCVEKHEAVTNPSEKVTCPTYAGWVVLAAVILSAIFTVAWTAQQLHKDVDDRVRPRHGMLVAALVLQLLVLVLAAVLAIATRKKTN